MTLKIIPTNILIVLQRTKKPLLLFNNVWKPQLEYKFPQLLDLNHTRFFQIKSMTKDLVLLRRERLNVAQNLKTLRVQIRGFADKNNNKNTNNIVTYLTVQKSSPCDLLNECAEIHKELISSLKLVF